VHLTTIVRARSRVDLVNEWGTENVGAKSGKDSKRTGRKARWWVAAVVVLLLFAVLWIGVRAFLARDALLGAVPIANRVGAQVLTAEVDVSDDLTELQTRARSAASLTSDPVWRVAEFVPILGSNLTAFREAAQVIDRLASDALPPLSALAGTVTADALTPVDGTLDLQVFVDAKPNLGAAREAMDVANSTATHIDTRSTIPQIGAAVDQIVDLVARAKNVIDGLDTAASLLPPMLGADGPKDYLLLSLNNAELRATGGLPGAIAVIHAEQGKLTLGSLSSATALGESSNPVLSLSEAEETLYGSALGTWMHDVNMTPDFPRTGALAQEIWLQRTGETVDGVVTIDPVALSYILSATGPVESKYGVTLSSANAADVLLSEVYARFATPSAQDAFFAEVTGKVFAAVTSGQADGATLVEALTRGADENRIHVWSADPNEQAELATTRVAGQVPLSSAEQTAFGVYFNDATGAKMDYYVDGAIAIGSAICRNDQRPNFEVKVRLTSSAPVDAATVLPEYVTGGGVYGVTPGNVSTNVFVYAPAGSVPYSVTIDGQEYSFVAAEHDSHSVAGVSVELAPGQTSAVSMKFVGEAGSAEAVALQHTPMASDVETSLDNYLDCDDIPAAPTQEEEEQSGALGVAASGGRPSKF
jgi:hypothetical protein